MRRSTKIWASSLRSRAARIVTLAAVGVLIAAVVAGLGACSFGEEGDTATGAVSQGSGDAGPVLVDSVTATGEGTIETSPDEAVIRVAVETENQDAAEAADANARSMQDVIDAVKAQGVGEDDLETMSVSVHPVRRYDPESRTDEPAGYRAENTVKVTLTDVSMVGDVFAAASEAGANRISGPDWRLSDDSEARKDALTEAVANARAKAEAMAQAAGTSVGDVIILNEGAVQTEPIYARDGDEALEQADTVTPPPTSPGVIEVRAQVTATYRLE